MMKSSEGMMTNQASAQRSARPSGRHQRDGAEMVNACGLDIVTTLRKTKSP
jgi:hypothetical protein